MPSPSVLLLVMAFVAFIAGLADWPPVTTGVTLAQLIGVR